VATGLRTTLATAVRSKAAAAVLTTVVAVGTIGDGTVAAANGAFGQQVKAHVESCKDAPAQGTHGIGECVSDFAQQHGAQQRQQHSQSQGHPASNSAHETDTHGNVGHHGGPPSGTPGAGQGNGHGKPYRRFRNSMEHAAASREDSHP